MSDIVERSREDARGFRERARVVRPHPANPHKVDAARVAQFIDVSCAYIAQAVDEQADEIERLREALQAIDELIEGNVKDTGQPHAIVSKGERHEGPLADSMVRILRGLQSIALKAQEQEDE